MVPPLPPLNFTSSSSAEGRNQSAFDSSGFSVDLSHDRGVPSWLIVALVAGAVAWIVHKG